MNVKSKDYHLSFEIDNEYPEGTIKPNTIYITTRPNENNLTLKITTNADTTIKKASKLVKPEQASDVTGSLIYLDLTDLDLTTEEFNKLAFEADLWNFRKFDDKNKRIVCMSPSEGDIELNNNANSSISISIKNMTLSCLEKISANLKINSYRVISPDDDLPDQFSIKIILLPSPSGGSDLHEVISVMVPGGDENIISTCNPPSSSAPIDLTIQANSIRLVFASGDIPRPVEASKKTRFIVTFIYDDDDKSLGYGALTTSNLAKNIDINRGAGAQEWGKEFNEGDLSWTLKPPEGESIVGTGSRSTVEFTIDNVQSRFRPGPTLMYITYKDITGYENGSYQILLYKVPNAFIESLDVSPNPAQLDENGQAQVNISWKSYDAETLMLENWGEDVTQKTNAKKIIDRTTEIKLSATGKKPDKNKMTTDPVKAFVNPLFKYFIAEPDKVHIKEFPHDIRLKWDSIYNENLNLISSITGIDPVAYRCKGNIPKTIEQPQTFTLVPQVDEKHTPVTKEVTISAFDYYIDSNKKLDLGNAGNLLDIAIDPKVEFIAVISEKKLSVYDIKEYKLIAEVIVAPIDNDIGCNQLTFSPDGSMIFITTSKNISVIQVDRTNSPYRFIDITSIDVGPSNAVAISPDGEYLYATVNNASDNSLFNQLAIVKIQENGNFDIVTRIDIGLKSMSIAVSQLNDKIFISSCDSNSISVIERSSGGIFKLAETINNLEQPISLAITSDGRILFVACNMEKVVGINTVTLLNQEFKFEKRFESYPIVDIVMAPSGASDAVVYFINLGSENGNITTHISYKDGEKEGDVLESLQTYSGLGSIAASPKGDLILVIDYEDSYFARVTIIKLHAITET